MYWLIDNNYLEGTPFINRDWYVINHKDSDSIELIIYVVNIARFICLFIYDSSYRVLLLDIDIFLLSIILSSEKSLNERKNPTREIV